MRKLQLASIKFFGWELASIRSDVTAASSVVTSVARSVVSGSGQQNEGQKRKETTTMRTFSELVNNQKFQNLAAIGTFVAGLILIGWTITHQERVATKSEEVAAKSEDEKIVAAIAERLERPITQPLLAERPILYCVSPFDLEEAAEAATRQDEAWLRQLGCVLVSRSVPSTYIGTTTYNYTTYLKERLQPPGRVGITLYRKR